MGAREHYEPDGTREVVSFDEVNDPTLAGYAPTRRPSGFDLFVRFRGDDLGHFDDLNAAEAEILRRYAAQWPAPQQKITQGDQPGDPSPTLK